MSTIIKARPSHSPQPGKQVAFNFDDVTLRANEQLQQARQQAAQIIAAAEKDAEQIRQQAKDQGKADADQAARQEVSRQIAENLKTVLPAIQRAAAEIEQARTTWVSQWDRRMVGLAKAIAARVIRRELSTDPEIPLALVRESLQLASSAPRIKLLLNPQDYQTLGQQVDELLAEFGRLGQTEIVGSDEIERGGCRVESQFGAIDQQFQTQLDRIESELAT